ncbi:MAG: hypothetical protein KF903_13540 [Dokdonella sp.]|uniref:radical SAM protein n=1 Tax=Dokdonella sp. TaxID=2291710 RepID=UPI0025B7D945|nr:radical SAM protein [Dokdonella sp.]MBX3702009.1 hypothetical protein [Dokdonella sp.]
MDTLDALMERSFPHTLTILTTYQCTAACRQCCFESSPNVVGRLSRGQILERIHEAKDSFPGLRLVVFSGGEAFLLKEDLYVAVELATSLGLMTRIVTNGSWGKSADHAFATANRLKLSGLTEINISTGADHQEWVPITSVANAAFALTKSGISTLITVETDPAEANCLRDIVNHPVIRDALQTRLLKIQSNSWMPFNEDAQQRKMPNAHDSLEDGCSQIFETVVVTPHSNLSACCGLTLEHIPEMRLGHIDEASTMRDLYRSQIDDFLKYWIHVDGPYMIIKRLLGDDANGLLKGVVHICQACVILHQNQHVREALVERYSEFVTEIMTRFSLEAVRKQKELEHVPLPGKTVTALVSMEVEA